MVRTLWLCVVAVAAASAALAALPGSRYRIELTNGEEITAADAPSQRGTVVVFHRASDGALDGVPAEMVARIESASAPRHAAAASAEAARAPGQALEPGEVVDLGTTDDAYVTPRADTAGAGPAAAAPPTPMWNGFYYGIGIGGGPARTPVNTLLASVPSSTDLALASGTSSSPALVGPNGFPVVPGAPVTVIGPDGTPTISPTATPLVIGPNGTPILDPNAPSPAVGSNGTPVLATAGTPGSVPLTIGSNGTPILAPAGSPGSVPMAIDVNGTPVLAPTFTSGATAMTVSGATVTAAAPAMAAPVAPKAAVVGHR